MHVIAVIHELNCLENKNIIKYPYPSGLNRYESLIMDTQMA